MLTAPRLWSAALRAVAVGLVCGGLAAPVLAQTIQPALSAAERAAIVQSLPQDGGQPSAERLDDGALAAALLRFAATELGQRIRPAEVDPNWALQPVRRDPAAELAEARRSGRLAAWLQALPAPYPGYAALRSAASRYRTILGRGGWAALPAGPALREGARDRQVALLRARLAAEGYATAPASAAALFDAGLRDALAAFQSHHALPPDGVLGPQTRTALNIPVAERLAQIEANLERWRWLPRDLPGDRLEIDIAGAEATLFRKGQPALAMRIVVGDPRHQTPMFASALESVVFNPPWNVPTSIAAAEILPKAARDPDYLVRNDFVWKDGRLQQLAGPKSALGLVKFDFPSPFGVYLHDTPSRSAFQRTTRALSHGCMRLEKPQELAAELLGPQGWSQDSVTEAIGKSVTQAVALKTRTPLLVMYWTAVAADLESVDFRLDVYGWDAKLTAALAAAAPHVEPAPTVDTGCLPAPAPRR
jgi:murein L,D-transpeptidase YcbB/YkuD